MYSIYNFFFTHYRNILNHSSTKIEESPIIAIISTIDICFIAKKHKMRLHVAKFTKNQNRTFLLLHWNYTHQKFKLPCIVTKLWSPDILHFVFSLHPKKGENAPNSVAKGYLVTLLYPYFYVNLRGIIVVKPANGKTPLKIVEQSFTDKIWVCACMFKFLRF